MNFGGRDDRDDDRDDDRREEVQDADGLVERRVKQRVMDRRQAVTDLKEDLFINHTAEARLTQGAQQLMPHEQVQLWATSVRQYLRAIEPLLRSDEIPDSEYYYRELEIVDRNVWPRDDTQVDDGDYKGTRIRQPDGSVRHEKIAWPALYEQDTPARANPLLGRGFKPPQPKRVELKGLKSVMEIDGISKQWHVPLNPREPEFRQEVAMPVWQQPLRKEWLDKAVAEADQFLNDNGLGFDIGSGDPHGAT